LFVGQQLGIPNDIDEQDMPDLQERLGFFVILHLPENLKRTPSTALDDFCAPQFRRWHLLRPAHPGASNVRHQGHARPIKMREKLYLRVRYMPLLGEPDGPTAVCILFLQVVGAKFAGPAQLNNHRAVLRRQKMGDAGRNDNETARWVPL